MIKIHFAFWPVAAFFFLSGYGFEFVVMLVFAAIHEAAHCVAANILGAEVDSVLITPLGFRARISGVLELGMKKAIKVFAAGPALSAVLSLIFLLAEPGGLFFLANGAIFLFNSLPFLPLDGGRVLTCIKALKKGYVFAVKEMVVKSRIFGIVLIAAGFILLILSPFNFSIMFMGIYIIKLLAKEVMIAKMLIINWFLHEKATDEKVSFFCFPEKNLIEFVIERLCPGKHIVLITKDGKLITHEQIRMLLLKKEEI